MLNVKEGIALMNVLCIERKTVAKLKDMREATIVVMGSAALHVLGRNKVARLATYLNKLMGALALHFLVNL